MKMLCVFRYRCWTHLFSSVFRHGAQTYDLGTPFGIRFWPKSQNRPSDANTYQFHLYGGASLLSRNNISSKPIPIGLLMTFGNIYKIFGIVILQLCQIR